MRVGQFLEGVGLGHHVDAFCDAEISGEVLLDATEEMLEELGVTSATERLKIKVNWGVTTLGQGSGGVATLGQSSEVWSLWGRAVASFVGRAVGVLPCTCSVMDT